jgi:G3E family GTPase
MNALARIHRASHADLPIERVLNLAAFDLDRALERKPTFLEPEYPFEWTGVWDLAPGATLDLGEGPDSSMSLVLLPAPEGADATGLRDGAERCVRLYAEPATDLAPGGVITPGRHLRLLLDGPGRKRFALDLPTPGPWALYTQHLAEEFDLKVRDAGGRLMAPAVDHAWSAQHTHDDTVTSVGLDVPGDLDPDRFNRWLSRLLRDQGPDIFRMKGFLSLAGEPERYVFQGVHMLFDSLPHGPWGETQRGNQLVFIGRNLDRTALESGLRACLA